MIAASRLSPGCQRRLRCLYVRGKCWSVQVFAAVAFLIPLSGCDASDVQQNKVVGEGGTPERALPSLMDLIQEDRPIDYFYTTWSNAGRPGQWLGANLHPGPFSHRTRFEPEEQRYAGLTANLMRMSPCSEAERAARASFVKLVPRPSGAVSLLCQEQEDGMLLLWVYQGGTVLAETAVGETTHYCGIHMYHNLLLARQEDDEKIEWDDHAQRLGVPSHDAGG